MYVSCSVERIKRCKFVMFINKSSVVSHDLSFPFKVRKKGNGKETFVKGWAYILNLPASDCCFFLLYSLNPTEPYSSIRFNLNLYTRQVELHIYFFLYLVLILINKLRMSGSDYRNNRYIIPL